MYSHPDLLKVIGWVVGWWWVEGSGGGLQDFSVSPGSGCKEGVPSQGGHQKEEHRVVHHVQEEHYEGHIQ